MLLRYRGCGRDCLNLMAAFDPREGIIYAKLAWGKLQLFIASDIESAQLGGMAYWAKLFPRPKS
jgi:hypothetical protein